MFWRLTYLGASMLLAVELPASATSPPATLQADRYASRATDASLHSVHWEQIPLGDAVRRLNALSRERVFLDRRVDPTQRLTLSIDSATAAEIAAQLAAACSLGQCRLDRLIYLGSKQRTERLPTLAAMRRAEVVRLSSQERRSLSQRKNIAWPRLTEPRDLVVRLMQEHGWRLIGSEQIPHDIWPEGDLPKLALADQLTVLLAGFDLTYRIVPEQGGIEIVPVDWDEISPAEPVRGPRRRAAAVASTTTQVYTLRVEEQPVGKILAELGRRFGWEIVLDEAAIRAAGRSLDQRVSFTVEKADADQIMEALLAPTGLTSERDGNRLHVSPRSE